MAEDNSEPKVESTPDAPGKVERLGFFANVNESFKHVSKSVDSQGSSLRQSDHLTALLVPATSFALLAAVLSGGWARLVVSIIAMAALLFYVLSRIGIMRTLNERQATLIWHIFLGLFLMGITFSFVFLEIVNRIR